jgi:two-component system, sensor histidine kinase PdtaS
MRRKERAGEEGCAHQISIKLCIIATLYIPLSGSSRAKPFAGSRDDVFPELSQSCYNGHDWHSQVWGFPMVGTRGIEAVPKPGSADELLKRIVRGLPILSDTSRADLLLYRFHKGSQVSLVAQARPHSILSLYSEPLARHEFPLSDLPAVYGQLAGPIHRPTPHAAVLHGTPIVRQVLPVRHQETGELLGALGIEANVLAYERHRRRSRAFQKALMQLQRTTLRGELRGAKPLTPFGEHDGIYVVDTTGRLLYVNGIATNFFRKLGYTGKLVGRDLESLSTGDDALVQRALGTQRCIEEEREEQGLTWIRKCLPLRDKKDWVYLGNSLRLLTRRNTESFPVGMMVTIRDDTEARRRAQEMRVQHALVQEVHHRVKNNLQTLASLLRLQSRRVESDEAEEVLLESINRIMSIAVVHEFLSKGEENAINIKDIGRRIVGQMLESLMDPTKSLHLSVEGPSIYLPARHATACSLIINELLQNAVEHAYEEQNEGNVRLTLVDEGELVHIHVQDDGSGLPPEFDLSKTNSLGLKIIQTLVQNDLRGEFAIENMNGGGTLASVTFTKQVTEKGRI